MVFITAYTDEYLIVPVKLAVIAKNNIDTFFLNFKSN